MYCIAIFGTQIKEEYFQAIYDLLNKLKKSDFEVHIYQSFYEHLHKGELEFKYSSFSDINNIAADFIFSLGGDGTYLKCCHLFYRFQIPILGINFGKLGFLADITPEHISDIIDDIKAKKFTIKERSLLDYSLETLQQNKYGIALNEISLQKSNILKLIKINTFVDGTFLTSFWADGIVISTPTGSTGYSLSLGGPILSPDSNAFVIQAIAPHTLSVRPIIVPDSSEIVIEAEGQYTNFLLSNDFKSTLIDSPPSLTIRKSNICVKTLQLESISFFETIRKKLQWGIDLRKY